MFSRKAKYALIAAIALSEGERNRHMVIEKIAADHKLPRKFLEAILLELRHAGILQSKKGRGGGYSLARDPQSISMAEVIRAIDGPLIPFRCIAIRADKTCEECTDAETCPIGAVMRSTESALLAVIQRTRLSDLVASKAMLMRRASAGAPDFEI